MRKRKLTFIRYSLNYNLRGHLPPTCIIWDDGKTDRKNLFCGNMIYSVQYMFVDIYNSSSSITTESFKRMLPI